MRRHKFGADSEASPYRQGFLLFCAINVVCWSSSARNYSARHDAGGRKCCLQHRAKTGHVHVSILRGIQLATLVRHHERAAPREEDAAATELLPQPQPILRCDPRRGRAKPQLTPTARSADRRRARTNQSAAVPCQGRGAKQLGAGMPLASASGLMLVTTAVTELRACLVGPVQVRSPVHRSRQAIVDLRMLPPCALVALMGKIEPARHSATC